MMEAKEILKRKMDRGTVDNDANSSLQTGMCQTEKPEKQAERIQKHLVFTTTKEQELKQMREKLSQSERKLTLAIKRWVVRERKMQDVLNELERKIEFKENENARLKRSLEGKCEDVCSLTILLENGQDMERNGNAKAKELLENLRSEKQRRGQTERILRESSQKRLLFDRLNEDFGTKKEEEELRQNCKELSDNEGGRERKTETVDCGELLKRTREEFFKQEVSLRKALKAKEDFITNLRKDYEEQMSWKDEEFTYFEKSTQGLLRSKDAELQTLSDQARLLLEDNKHYRDAVDMKNNEINMLRVALTSAVKKNDIEHEGFKKVSEQVIRDKADEITRLRIKLEELLEQQADKMLVLKEEKEDKVKLIYQQENEKEGIKEEMRKKEVELETVKMTAREDLCLKDEEIESVKRTVVGLQESVRKSKQELDKLKKKMEDAEEINRQQNARHENELWQKQEHLKKTMEEVLRARENELVELLERSEQALDQKEVVITAMREYTSETAAKDSCVLRGKEARIADLEDSVGQSARNYEELEKKLSDSLKLTDELQVEISELKAKENSLKENLTDLENSLEKTKEEKDTFETTLTVTRCEFNNEIKEIQHEMERSIAKLTEEASQKEESFKEAVSLCERKQKKNKELQEQLAISQEEITLRESQIWQLNSALRSLESDKNAVDEENTRVKTEVQMIAQTANERNEEAQKYRSRARTARKEISELLQSLKTTSDSVEVTKSELEQRQRVLDESVREVDEARRKYEEEVRLEQKLSSHNKVLEDRVKELERILGNKERKIESLGVVLEEQKQNRLRMEHYVDEISEKLEREKSQNEVLGSALEKVKEGFDELRDDSKQVKLLMTDRTSSLQRQIDDFQRVLDDKGKILLEASKQKESLLQELKEVQETERSRVRKMAETLMEALNKDKVSLAERLEILEVQHRRAVEDKAELRGLLKSAEFTKTRLDNEVSALKELLSGKESKLAEALRSVEVSEKENQRLKLELKDYDVELRCEVDKKKEIIHELEQLKTETSRERSHVKGLLARKVNDIKELHENLEELRNYNRKLKEHLEDITERLETEKTLSSCLREESTKLDGDNETLRRDNEVFRSIVKDMETQAMKLNMTEDALLKEREMAKQLKEQLLNANSQRKSLMTSIKEVQSTNEEVRNKMELRIQSLLSEADQLREQRDERNKEFYALREEKCACEMQRRETALKMKELENTLRNEASLRDAVLRRKRELEQEIQNLRENKFKEVTILKAALDNTVRDITLRGKHAQLPLENDVDNQTVQKMCELYKRISELRDELQEKGSEGLRVQTSLARTQAELSVFRENRHSNTELDGV